MGDIARMLAEAGTEIDGEFAAIDARLDGAFDGVVEVVEMMRGLEGRVAGRLSAIEARIATLEAPPPPPDPPPAPRPPGWELVWSDEFDRDGAPDPAKWTCGQNSWGGNTLGSEHQAWHPGHSYIRAGILRLEAERALSPIAGKSYASGIVHTKGKAEWTPPLRVEVRARYPVGNGFWPGIWLLHDQHRKANTYEIDILEVMGNKPAELYHTYHWYPADFDHKEIDCWRKQPPTFDVNGWHIYALEWYAHGIYWFIDGQMVNRIDANDANYPIVTVPPSGPRTTATGKPIIPDARYPHHLIIDLSLGGWGGNAPDATTPLPSALEVDFVRVSRWKE